jgi:molybdenum cofactor cytidylyltransferase
MLKQNVYALIVSAGFSSRMKEFKPLMPFKGVPFIISVICKSSHICNKIYVVTGYRDEDIRKEIRKWLEKKPKQETLEFVNFSINQWVALYSKIKFIYNKDYKLGMFSSLKTGLKQMEKSDWILYHFVDQPHIPVDFYNLFIEQLDDAYHWIQPQYQRQNAHPIFLRKDLAVELIKSDSAGNLKSFSSDQSVKKKFWNCDYPQILSDFNTPDSLKLQGESYGHL